MESVVTMIYFWEYKRNMLKHGLARLPKKRFGAIIFVVKDSLVI